VGMLLAAFLAFSVGVEVERVLALVNGVPVLASDVELAELAGLVPRESDEDIGAYRQAVTEALVALELRWQDLTSTGAVAQVKVDLDAAWARVVSQAGGEEVLRSRLAAAGLPEALVRDLVRRGATVEAYVANRFAPFVRTTREEVDSVWQRELRPQLEKAGEPVPDLETVQSEVTALVRERKLVSEVERWTLELEKRGEVVRYFGPPEK
jgi:hypothetical protein